MAFGRVGILTAHQGLINTNITIAIDNLPYQITIVEDIFESSRLSPVMARNDFDFHPSTQWNINGDDFGSNGDDVDDFGEYEVDTEGDIDDIPLLEASMELQAYLVEGESTPETVVENLFHTLSNNIINGKTKSGSQSSPDSRHLSPTQLQEKKPTQTSPIQPI